MIELLVRLLKLLVFFGFAGLCHAQMFEGRQLVTADLLAAADGIVPGQRAITVGLRLRTQPGWNTYWQYAGDAGIPTTIDWTLPPGFKAGPIHWPVPERISEPGDIVIYGYRGNVVLPVIIQVPENLRLGQTIAIRAHATWLVCKDICVPGKADLILTLPVVAAIHANSQFALGQMPDSRPRPFTTSWSRQGQDLLLNLGGGAAGSLTDFYPLPGDVQIGHPVRVPPSSFRIPLLDPNGKATSIDGLVVREKGLTREAWQLHLATLYPSSFRLQPSASAHSSLLYWLCLGFLGGLILNVMPCVLPVIALKIFGFIRQAGESPRRILALGFTFVAGIFAWFLFLAALIVGFKSAGHQLNWAFQFQHPAFVAVMVVILLLFSLNLLGFFEIVLPGQVQAMVHEAAGREGYAGTFWHGVFATLMATPCTAPFLGPALGFALAQPALTVFAMFGSIAAGMSAPYALLALKPAWLRYLPRPGLWMVRVKQALGLLLLGTVLWLGWVLFQQFTNRPQPFPPRLAQAIAQNKIVFVDFTADWCVNCKVNERLVLDSSAVQDAFRQRGVILLKADWTSGDSDITALLRKFGRAGVPCYVVYPPGGQPIVLPEVITREIVLHALDQAAS